MARLTQPVTVQDFAQGPASAPVTLVEYGDFECPHCGEAYPIVKQLQEALGSRLRFVYRHFPLSEIHPHAAAAAEAAESAGNQARFWEMHDLLFENQQALDLDSLLEYARRLGLDTDRLYHDLSSHAYARLVEEDFMGGVRSGVNGTPTYFINAERFDGPSTYEALLAALEEAAAANP